MGAPLGPEAVDRVLATLNHRGPDSNGVARPEGATLVHTRLRIIDLSPAGAQPMPNEDGTVWVTFNGEIYNFQELRRTLEQAGHTFRSHSDTEVLVHGYEQWGDALCERLDGMFAFGIWDVPRRRLMLARDRAGKKPLYYAEHDGRFLFASEIKALFAAGVPLDISPEGVVGYLAYGFTPPPATPYRDVAQLPPATRLVREPGGAKREHRYWSIDFQARGRRPDEREAAATVRTLLTEAVRKRMVADVPVGAFLSGGLDSTIVVGLMAELGHRARTFSIGFEGDPRYDETHYARIAARACNTDHTEFRVTPSDFELVEKLVWHHDGPFGDSSGIPTYVVSRLTRQHVTVALNGDGGDELFAGYTRFIGAVETERVPRPLRPLAGWASRLLPAGGHSRGLPARARRLLRDVSLPLGDRLTRWTSYFALSLDETLTPELHRHCRRTLDFHRDYFAGQGDQLSPLAAALNHNFDTYLPFHLLVKMDRTSMANALETRSPFLDTALTEYVAGLPDDYKLRGRTTKYILRRAFTSLMPPEITGRGKMGFGMPLHTWFRGHLRSYLMDHIASPRSLINQYVRPEVVTDMVAAHMKQTADYAYELWALLTLEIWLRSLSRLARPWDDADSMGPGPLV